MIDADDDPPAEVRLSRRLYLLGDTERCGQHGYNRLSCQVWEERNGSRRSMSSLQNSREVTASTPCSHAPRAQEGRGLDGPVMCCI